MAVKLSERAEQPNFEKIIEEVLTKGKCTDCGICEAVCYLSGAGVVKYERQAYRVYDSEKCVRCGLCQASCPVTSFDTSDADYRVFRGFMGKFVNIRSFKSTNPKVLERCQDGGAATSLLLYMIDAGIIDAAMVTNRLENWVPRSRLTNDKDEIIEAGGSKYASNPIYDVMATLKGMPEADLAKLHVKSLDDLRLSVTGLPCQVSGLRKVQNLGIFPSNLIKVRVGLFCFKNFNWFKLREYITKDLKIKMEDIDKFQIKGDMLLTLKDGKQVPVKSADYERLVNEGCLWCKDLTAHDADISCGNIGSRAGATTVVTRTKKGHDIVERARLAGYLEEVPLENMALVGKLAGLKLKKSKKDEGA